MTVATSYIKDELEAHGVKPSAQRMVILRHLMEHRTHPTVDEIHSQLREEHPTLSRTTVYNTLKLFAESGLIKCIETSLGEGARWDYSTDDHAHFLCQTCGCVTDIEFDPNASSLPLPSGGHRVNSVSITYKGICPQCLARLN